MGNTHFVTFNTICPVCGVPVSALKSYGHTRAIELERDWLTRTILLHLTDEKDESPELLESQSPSEGGPFYLFDLHHWKSFLEGPPSFVENRPHLDDNPPLFERPILFTGNPPLYILLHQACLKMARVFIEVKNRTENKNVSLLHIWEVVEKRYDLQMVERHRRDDYSLPLTNLLNTLRYKEIEEHQLGNFDELEGFDYYSLTNPLEIPEMTESLVKNLQSFDGPSFWSNFWDGGQDAIMKRLDTAKSDLYTPRGASLECTRKLSPSVWLQVLLESKIIPWLWDLDPEVLRLKQESKPDDTGWDWELLVRQLVQPDFHVPEAVETGIPDGVRNRQRLWRLLGDLLVEEV